MSTQERTDNVTVVRIEAVDLPCIVDELRFALSGAAERLHYATNRGEALTSVAVDAARVRTLVDVLDQIGWQTVEPVEIEGRRETLHSIFESVGHGCEESLRDHFYDPADRRQCERAMAAAEDVVAQLTGEQLPIWG